MGKEIRYYQREAKEAINKKLDEGVKNQLLVMATGTGKTFTAVNLIKDKGRVLWGTHTEELIEQSAISLLAELDLMPYDTLIETIKNSEGLLQLLRKGYNLTNSYEEGLIMDSIGVVKADLFDIDKPIVVASMQTLWRRLDKMPEDHFKVVVVDEAHYAGAKTWVKSLSHFKSDLRLGLTATPHRQDGMLLGDIFDCISYEYPIEKGIKDGYLCEIDAIRVRTKLDLDKVKTVAGDLNQGQLEELINIPERNKLIVEKYKQHAMGRQFLAFCVDVQHALDLSAMFNEMGVDTNFIVGDKNLTTDRKGLIDSFKAGELTGLTNCMVLTAGFDHPNVGCVIMACPTKSLTKFLQQLGRGTRLKLEEYVARFGQNVIILDVVDSSKRHRVVNTWTLDKQKPPEERVFITEENREKLIQSRIERRMEVSKGGSDIKVNLLKLPKVHVSMSYKMQDPATQPQLDWIAREGYDIVNKNYTKAMCNEIINGFSASDKQIWRLAQEGYDVSNGVTVTEAKLAFTEIEEKKEREEREQKAKEFKNKHNLPFNDLN